MVSGLQQWIYTYINEHEGRPIYRIVNTFGKYTYSLEQRFQNREPCPSKGHEGFVAGD
jgi:hypothetical protein